MDAMQKEPAMPKPTLTPGTRVRQIANVRIVSYGSPVGTLGTIVPAFGNQPQPVRRKVSMYSDAGNYQGDKVLPHYWVRWDDSIAKSPTPVDEFEVVEN